MRPIRKITNEEENLKIVNIPWIPQASVIKKNFVKPEPEGTIVLIPFRITKYQNDCDGSALASLEAIDTNGEIAGWGESGIGLYPETALVTTLEEMEELTNGQ